MESPPPIRIDSDVLPAGTVVDGKYEVIDSIGSGGFARVYKAKQLNIERPVAIKLLNAFSDPDQQESYTARFLQEARVAAQIRHPNVVSIYDFGVFHDRPFIIMELLEGYDLKYALKSLGPFEPERARELVLDALDALGKGHEKGIVHKDLKPGNLFIHDPDRRSEALRILDFGIARVQHSVAMTQSQQVLGTPRYYAPEYVQKRIVSPALDVYQAALILVEMMIAEPLVGINDPFLCMMHHCTGQIPVPVTLWKSSLGPVLAGALATEHFKRYQDGHAFRDALEDVDLSSVGQVDADSPRAYLRDVKLSGGKVRVPRDAVFPASDLKRTGSAARSNSGGAVLARETNDTVITPGAQASLKPRLGATVHLPSGEFDPDMVGSASAEPTQIRDIPYELLEEEERRRAPVRLSVPDDPTSAQDVSEFRAGQRNIPLIIGSAVGAMLLIGLLVGVGAAVLSGSPEPASPEVEAAAGNAPAAEDPAVAPPDDGEASEGGGAAKGEADDEAAAGDVAEGGAEGEGSDEAVADGSAEGDAADAKADDEAEAGDAPTGGDDEGSKEAAADKAAPARADKKSAGSSQTKRRRRRGSKAIPLLPTLTP